MGEIGSGRKNSRMLTMIVMIMIPWQINFNQGENIIFKRNSRPCHAIVIEMAGVGNSENARIRLRKRGYIR